MLCGTGFIPMHSLSISRVLEPTAAEGHHWEASEPDTLTGTLRAAIACSKTGMKDSRPTLQGRQATQETWQGSNPKPKTLTLDWLNKVVADGGQAT